MIKHTCRRHGELAEADIVVYGRKRNRKECRICKRTRDKKHAQKNSKKNSEEKKAAISEIDSVFKQDNRTLSGQKAQLRIMRLFNNFKLK